MKRDDTSAIEQTWIPYTEKICAVFACLVKVARPKGSEEDDF